MTATWPRSFEDVDRKKKKRGGRGEGERQKEKERANHFGGLSVTKMNGSKTFATMQEIFFKDNVDSFS